MKGPVGPPRSVQVEIVEGCTRACAFCGINAIRKGPGGFKFMPADLAELYASRLARFVPTARYEFAMHGEPTVHPEYLAVLRRFRQALPGANMMLVTNGVKFRGHMAAELNKVFELVDVVMMDTYQPERDELLAEATALSADTVVRDFYRDLTPQGWSPWANHKRKYRRLLVLMDDLAAMSGKVASRTISNHAGSAPPGPVPVPLQKTCTIPFRELSVCWNGDVNLCCNDWTHASTCGNLAHERAEAIWYGDRFSAARRLLAAKHRDAIPTCTRCNAGSGARVGLLPKQEEPTAADFATWK